MDCQSVHCGKPYANKAAAQGCMQTIGRRLKLRAIRSGHPPSSVLSRMTINLIEICLSPDRWPACCAASPHNTLLSRLADGPSVKAQLFLSTNCENEHLYARDCTLPIIHSASDSHHQDSTIDVQMRGYFAGLYDLQSHESLTLWKGQGKFPSRSDKKRTAAPSPTSPTSHH